MAKEMKDDELEELMDEVRDFYSNKIEEMKELQKTLIIEDVEPDTNKTIH